MLPQWQTIELLYLGRIATPLLGHACAHPNNHANSHAPAPALTLPTPTSTPALCRAKIELNPTSVHPALITAMDDSSSPESAGAAMALFTASDGSNPMLDGDYDDFFVKEESDSPPPEEDKRRFLIERRQSSKSNPKTLSSRAQRTSGAVIKSGKSSGKLQAAQAASRGAPLSSRLPLIPRKAEDWDPWKSILYELYITQNRILRDIINIMDTTYNLKATPKMYKNQFARWGFFKYAVKRRPRIKSDARAVAEDQDADIVIDDLDDSFDTAIVPMIHQNRSSRAMQSGMTAVQHFVHGYVELDAANAKEEAVLSLHEPFYRYFKTAMDLFDLKDHVQGGRVLRLAFLQIEPKISAPTMKSFADLCFLVPHLLLESDRKDILSAYLTYLTRLVSVKFGNHPLAEIISSFADLLDRPEEIMRYIMILSQINAETIANVPAIAENTQDWAKNLYLACQRSIKDDKAIVKKTHDHHMIRLEAQGVYWAQKLILQDPESEHLALQWLHRKFDSDFPERVQAFREKTKGRIEAGELPQHFSRLMESLMLGWLNDYYETAQDWPKMFEWGKQGLALATDEQYVIWSINLEGLMRKYGSAEEADELRRRRLEHEWLERNSTMSEVYKLTLDKQVKGTGGPLTLEICITALGGDEMDCYLTGVDLKGTPAAEGLEIELKEEKTTFVGNQTWRLKKKYTVVVEDEDENEVEIVLQNVVIKIFDGEAPPSAKATVGTGESSVELATQNWTDDSQE
ncbi:hypothetical protein B0H66DRAFT_601406 [Apodospora peruviana]|uniref:Clr5 domain-containing protein n=1 Tax=Apodospora peruviana TaxID=516989 RepID=A0AAE0IBF9_9PEZI|nr:hypothetical protein B0H66DRAFT_601406 [Apodospora peruviana]